jgi:hypothetical protein
MTTRGVLAVVVTMKERGDLALRTLRSLRPYVDHLALYCNGYSDTPDWLRPPHASEGLVDFIHLDPANEAKDLGNLFWAGQHEGVYLSCDDDLEYAPQYPLIFTHWIERYADAICTTHGLRFNPRAQFWKTEEWITVVVGGKPVRRKKVQQGWQLQTRWDKPLMHKEAIHQPGTGIMGWDTRRIDLGKLHWRTEGLVPGESDLSVALWAYRNAVPVLAIPHGGWECSDILPKDAPSLWAASKASNFDARNKLIRTQDWINVWQSEYARPEQ